MVFRSSFGEIREKFNIKHEEYTFNPVLSRIQVEKDPTDQLILLRSRLDTSP